MKEIWKPISDYVGLYEVNYLGEVRSVERVVCRGGNTTKKIKSRLLKPQQMTSGYLFVSLSKCGKRKCLSIHRLVACAFIANNDNKPQVNHINENKHDNRVENLEWVSCHENTLFGTGVKRRVTNSNFKGKNNPMYGKIGALNTRSKAIEQYSIDDKLLKTFDSAASIERTLGFNASSIIGVARGRTKTAYGYKWKYV